INTSLCELWDDEGQNSIGVPALLARREVIGAQLPAAAVAFTVGVDVQGDRLELEMVGWGRGEESWSLDYRVIPGDTLGPEPWRELDKYLAKGWTHPTLGEVFVGACCVDSGYITQTVFEYARDRYGRRVFAVKGKSGNYPVWPKRPTRRQGGNMFIVGVDSAKATLMGRLRIGEPGPGYCHFPTDRGEEYFDQLLSEVLTTTYRKGRPHREWIRRKGMRAEALDCRNYAYGALQALAALGLRLDAEADRVAALGAAGASVARVETPVYAVSRSRFMG
ncbi:MAG: phage terminase large subunit family protein, partial [Acidobacteria bacterium]|nr:phage terminase large subunit family protein [Acidobacteriota bacterium]